MKSLRKPYISIFLASLILFVSCSQYDNDYVPKSIDELVLKNTHNDIKINLSNLMFDYANISSKTSEESEAEKIYLKNVEYLNLHGIEQLFIKNNVDTEIIAELEYFDENQYNENVYKKLIENFNIDNQQEASMLFTIIEIKKIIEQELKNISSTTMSEEQDFESSSKKTMFQDEDEDQDEDRKLSWSCVLAIAGVVSVSVFAIIAGPITGGGSLVAFLGSKAIATVAIIEACGEGWGDIN